MPARISSRPRVWTWRGLVTFYTVFVIDLASRRVHIVGSTPHPDERFMQQVVRTLTAAPDGLLGPHHVLICDEVYCEEEACFIKPHRIDASRRTTRRIVASKQVPSNHRIGDPTLRFLPDSRRTISELVTDWKTVKSHD